MKQKMVMKVSMNGQKNRSKAMKIAVSLPGVESAGFKGDDKTQIEITGNGVDAVELATMLRKKFGSAEVISVAPVEEEKTKAVDKPKEDKVEPVNWFYGVGGVPYFYNHLCYDNNCRVCYYY